jgi:DNA ligase-1
MKPMLAATIKDMGDLRYPLYASPKLDGVRGLIVDGQLVTRSLKPIPNSFVSARFARRTLSGLDGELILGSPTAKDVYRATNAACARRAGEPDVKFYVFDMWHMANPYETRVEFLRNLVAPHVVVLPHRAVRSEAELLEYEAEVLGQGYEGLILRHPDGQYKFGRSTVREGGMLKLKRFDDSEFLLLDVEEEMENTNEAKKNALGRTERSSAQAGLVGKGRAGTLVVRDVFTGVEFRIGTGLDDEDKKATGQVRRQVQELLRRREGQAALPGIPRAARRVGHVMRYEVRVPPGRLIGLYNGQVPSSGMLRFTSGGIIKSVIRGDDGHFEMINFREVVMRLEVARIMGVDTPTLVLTRGKASWLKGLRGFRRV